MKNSFGKVGKAETVGQIPRVRGAKARAFSGNKEKYSRVKVDATTVMKAARVKAGAMMKALQAKKGKVFVQGKWDKGKIVSGPKEKTSSGMKQFGLKKDKFDKVVNAKKKIVGPRVRGAKARGFSVNKEKYSRGLKATAMKAAMKVMKAVMRKGGAMVKAMKAQ